MKSFHPSVFKIPLWISLCVTLFLFYIDEGYYDLRWMKDPGNWFVFMIYVVGIYAILLAVAVVINLVTKLAKQLVN